MWRKHRIVWPAVVAVGLLGCGGSDQPDAKTPAEGNNAQADETAGSPLYVGNARGTGGAGRRGKAQLDGPAAAVARFLTAYCQGEDEKTSLMLTNRAREVTGNLGLKVAPPGSDTAQFQIHEIKYIDENGAQVVCTWSDLDRDLERQTEKLAWVVRREPEGWRIAGVATAATQDEAAHTVNFEDARAMAALVPKPQSSDAQPPPRAQRPGPPSGPIRR